MAGMTSVAGSAGSAAASQGSFAAISQEPARIREDFSRILQGATAPASVAAGVVAHLERVLPPVRTRGDSGGTASGSLVASCDVDSVGVAWPHKGIDLESLFPVLFSFCGFVVFLGPIWLMVHLSHDPSVVYWVGRWCEVALLLPLPFFAAFFIHARLRRPHKATVLASLLVPAATLLVLGDVLTTVSSERADQLRSMDCDTFARKRGLEHSWQAARRLYMGCLHQTVPAHNLTMAEAMALFRVQDCEEFASMYDLHEKDWEYLWYLEEEHQCSGWCSTSPPLWTLKDVSDSCSIVVAQLFAGKVRRMANQIVICSIIILVGTSLSNLMAGPGIRAMGVEW